MGWQVDTWSVFALATAVVLTALLEAVTSQVDNFVLPLYFTSVMNALCALSIVFALPASSTTNINN